MFGIGANELIIILLFGFLIFGPDKLPAMAKTIGKAIAKFRTAQQEMNNVIRNEVYDPNSDDPFKNPLDALAKVEDRVTREDRGESFSERKARYDKQRAASKAAKERTARGEGAKEVAETTNAKPASETADAESAAEEPAATTEGAKPKISADELYGVSTKARKPKKSAGSDSSGTDAGAGSKAGKSDAPAARKAASALGGEVEQVAEEATDAPAAKEGE